MPRTNDNTTPTVFIGSSSEGLEVAQILQSQIVEYNAYVWNQGLFTPGSYPLEVLDKQIKARDFAVFVCTPDDPIVKRNQESIAARDNVIFELGLFMGAIGRDKTFMFLPAYAKVELPTDLSAITQIRYDDRRFAHGYQDKIAAIQTACLSLRHQIGLIWGKLQEAKRRSIMTFNEDKRIKSLRRLHSVIVQMRDLIIVFPGQLLGALTDLHRFESVKLQASANVDRLIDAFHEDAVSSNLVPELTQLALATKSALVGFPIPIDPTEAGKAFRTALVAYAGKIFSNIAASKEPLQDIGNMVETEIEKQLRAFVEKYELWWKNSRTAIEVATVKLQDALFTASIDLNGRLLMGHLDDLAA